MAEDLENKIAKFAIRVRYTYAMRNLCLAHYRNEHLKDLRHTVTGLPVPDKFNTKLTLRMPKDWVVIWANAHIKVRLYLDNLRRKLYEQTKESTNG